MALNLVSVAGSWERGLHEEATCPGTQQTRDRARLPDSPGLTHSFVRSFTHSYTHSLNKFQSLEGVPWKHLDGSCRGSRTACGCSETALSPRGRRRRTLWTQRDPQERQEEQPDGRDGRGGRRFPRGGPACCGPCLPACCPHKSVSSESPVLPAQDPQLPAQRRLTGTLLHNDGLTNQARE